MGDGVVVVVGTKDHRLILSDGLVVVSAKGHRRSKRETEVVVVGAEDHRLSLLGLEESLTPSVGGNGCQWASAVVIRVVPLLVMFMCGSHSSARKT